MYMVMTFDAVAGTSGEKHGRSSGAVEAFSRRNVTSSGRHGEHSRQRTSEDGPSSKDVQLDSERGYSSRNGSSSKRAAVSNIRPSSMVDLSSRVVSSTGRASTTQRTQPGVDQKPSSFSRSAVNKGTRDDPLRSFEFLSLRK